MKSLFLAFTFFATLIWPACVQAEDASFPGRALALPGSPIAVLACNSNGLSGGFYYRADAAVTVFNRARNELRSFRIEYKFYDEEGSLIGSKSSGLDLGDALMSGESNIYSMDPEIGSGYSRIAYMTCRPLGATFRGGRRWSIGHRWTQPLLPIPHGTEQVSEQSSVRGSDRGAIAFTVINSWNDAYNNALLVHDKITVNGPAHISASTFALKMLLPNGTFRTYRALETAAPSYEKVNPLTNETNVAQEVDPREDLGSMGSVTIPSGSAATLVVTFSVPDVVSDKKANRGVIVRSI